MIRLTLAAASVVILAGCSGTSTYGTGTTQEAQLVKDLAGMTSFKRQKKAKIDYSERAALVKPTEVSELPTPQETDTSTSAFPVSPEEAGGTSAKPRIVRRGEDDGLSEEDRKFMNWQGDNTKAYREWTNKRVKEMKARQALQKGDGTTRKYFTEPPSDYRKPYESAPAGEVGDTEASKSYKKKQKGNIFSKLLGRG